MATVDGPKYMGPLIFDLTNVKDMLVDLAPGAMRGIRTEKPGFDKVAVELATAVPNNGDKANIPPQVYQHFVGATADIALLRAHETALEKALEICRESLAKKVNDREDDISIMATAAQDTARRKKDPGIAAPFEVTINYNSQIADKAVQTKKKNAEAEKEAEAKGGGPIPPVQGGGQNPPA